MVGDHVLVASMMPRDVGAPGWEHAVVYAIDARTGTEVARRVLPDPVPVAAMVVQDGVLHIVATCQGEPIFWYALSPVDLVARHRRVVALEASHDDVLEAWSSPDGGLWLELEATSPTGSNHALTYVFADATGGAASTCRQEDDVTESAAVARDACVGGLELYAPVDGAWAGDVPVAPALSRLSATSDEEKQWVSAAVTGPSAQIHAMAGDDVVCCVAAAEDPERRDRARVEAFEVDRASGAVRWRAQHDAVELKPGLGEGARMARRPNGEMLFQSLGADGSPSSALLCARSDGRLDAIALGTRGRYVLDAALGDMVLAHRENAEGVVELAGFSIDREGRLLGRRAALQWSIEVGNLGAATTVYAGAGVVVVRGTRAVCAVRL